MTSTIQTITTVTGNPLWILETRRSAYVFGIDTAGYLQHVYWGAKLVSAADYETPEAYRERRTMERTPDVSREEFPLWGDYSYGEPCLKAQYADGVRTVLMQYVDSAVEGNTLTVRMKDPYYALSLTLTYRVIPEHDLIERSAIVENTGADAIDIERIMSASWHLPRRAAFHLRTMSGKWAGEFQIQEADVPEGKQVIEHRRGASTFNANPWFSLDAGDADETGGEVWFGALAFSGNWKLILERTSYGQTTLTGGINDFDFRWHLESGERFETPVFVGGFTEHGYGEASRLLHDYQLDYVLPQPYARTARPVVYNSWYVTGFDVNEENQVAAAVKARELGVEVFMMDDGWFSTRNHDRAGLGDWFVAPDKFPNGLGPMIQRINDLGLKFGIWVEPEMVNPDSDLYRTHPDWVYFFPNRPRSEGRNQLVLNFARRDVLEYVWDFLDRILGENHIEYLKWDMNRHFSEPGWPEAPAGRDREIWVRHTQGIYEILRRIREKYPYVMIESCSGGGGRVDLGVLRYVDLFWESDNTDPYDDLFMFEGFSQVYASLTRLRLVTDPININNRGASAQYAYHDAMMGMLGIGADINHWSDEKTAEVRALVDQYKAVRETIHFGHVYRLLSPRSGALAATQFVSRDGGESVAFAFLHSSRFGLHRSMLRLQGLEPEAMYLVDEDTTPISGQALMKRGLHLDMRGDFVSRMFVIKRI
jgi:alpha-galactosidase